MGSSIYKVIPIDRSISRRFRHKTRMGKINHISQPFWHFIFIPSSIYKISSSIYSCVYTWFYFHSSIRSEIERPPIIIRFWYNMHEYQYDILWEIQWVLMWASKKNNSIFYYFIIKSFDAQERKSKLHRENACVKVDL